MSPLKSLTNSTKWSGLTRGIKKAFYWFLAIIVLVAGVFIYFRFFFTYSEGYRAGLLQKFSKKGVIFKTYEGELILSSVSSTSNVAIASEKFYFSVVNRELVPRFDTLQGENVIIHYQQKNGAAFWRGDSKYLVDSIKIKR